MLSIQNMIGTLGDMESSVFRVSTSEKAYVKSSSKHKYGSGSVAFMQANADIELTYVLKDASGQLSCRIDNTHKYYFSIWIMQRTSLDITFDAYWPIAEPPLMRGVKNEALNIWEQKSAVFDRSGFSNGAYPFRIDCNNYPGSNAIMNVDGLVLVDLTAAFGAGYEPTKDWCDSHIPFGTGELSVPEPIPNSPKNFRITSNTKDTVSLAWDASKFAAGYLVYQDGALVATVTDTSCTLTVRPFVDTKFTVAAYNGLGRSAKTSPVHIIVYDFVAGRTEADVTARNSKGTYNASDLNRVGAAMIYVADRLRAAGYDPHISPKTDWSETGCPTTETMARYLADLADLRGQFAQAKTTPPVPASMEGLTWQEANDIEKILEDVDALLTNIAAGWYYSGEIYAGEV